jgi:hypothetical protein
VILLSEFIYEAGSGFIYQAGSGILDFEWHPPDVVADFVHIIHHPIVLVLL